MIPPMPHDRRSACVGILQSISLLQFLPRTKLTPATNPLSISTERHSPLERVARSGTSVNPAALPASVTLPELASFLVTHTPRDFRTAVRSSGGKFLYRGAEPEESRDCANVVIDAPNNNLEATAVQTCNPPPDLLLEETYGNNPEALLYFQRLEETLLGSSGVLSNLNDSPLMAKPSNGHIATSDPFEAGKWGSIVSIWPLVEEEDDFSYVWPRKRALFYQEGSSTVTEDVRLGASVSLILDRGLLEALRARDGREVLFATRPSSAFVAVPYELDRDLRASLEAIGYGL